MSPRLTLCPGDTHLYYSLLLGTSTLGHTPLLFSALGTHTSSLLWGTSTLLYSWALLLFSSLLPTSTILCLALPPTSSLLCFTLATLPRAQLSPGTNLKKGSMLHWALGQLRREKVSGENSLNRRGEEIPQQSASENPFCAQSHNSQPPSFPV